MQLLIILLSFASLSCETWQAPDIPDDPLCIEKIKDELGRCTWTSSGKVQFIDNDKQLLNNEKWIDVKKKSLIMPSLTWEDIKIYLLQSCQIFNNCPQVQMLINQMEK